MNLLAHAFLAPNASAERVGNMMGDSLRGRLERLAVPDAMRTGVRLHRYIDSFIDQHPIAQRSRLRLPLSRRRASGIVVDMAYDHFLARHWRRFHAAPLAQFTRCCYQEAAWHSHWLPSRGARVLAAMRHDDWLAGYASIAAVSQALERLGQRLSRPALLRGSGDDILANYTELEADFLAFMPEMQQAVGAPQVAQRGQ